MNERAKEERAIKKLRELLAKEELLFFSKDEVQILRNIIKVYRGLLALGWLGIFVRNVILIIISILSGYFALTGAVTQWIKKIVEGG